MCVCEREREGEREREREKGDEDMLIAGPTQTFEQLGKGVCVCVCVCMCVLSSGSVLSERYHARPDTLEGSTENQHKFVAGSSRYLSSERLSLTLDGPLN